MPQYTGTCEYCGRVQMLTVSGALSQSEADEVATRTCTCDEARRHAAGASASEAILRIAEGEDGGASYGAEIISALCTLADLVIRQIINSAQLAMPDGDTVKIVFKSGDTVITRVKKKQRVEIL